jgi:hypothetical protein
MIRPTVHLAVEMIVKNKARLELLLLQVMIFILKWNKLIEARLFLRQTLTLFWVAHLQEEAVSCLTKISRCSDPVWHHIPMQVRVIKYRNSVNAEHDLSVTLPKTEPRIDMLVENFNQPHTSH